MIVEKVYFNSSDGLELFGLLHKPENGTNKVVVAIHGMSSNGLKPFNDLLAKEFVKNDIAYFSFNNRGAEYASKFKQVKEDGTVTKYIGGCMYEEILDSKYDCISSIREMLNKGYTDIYLQGHSLGSTKVVYSYNELVKDIDKEDNKKVLEAIKAVILLSLVDLLGTQKYFLGSKFNENMEYAEELEKEGRGRKLMPEGSCINPLSAKAYLRLFKNNELINFAQYGNEEYEFKELSNIKVPLLMRWGNDNEMILQSFDKLLPFLKEKIENDKLDIGYIDGANHHYAEKEKELADEIIKFIT